MRRILSFAMLVLLVLVISGCTYRAGKYPQAKMADENWYSAVDTSAEHWKAGASSWFLTGDAYLPKQIYKDMPAQPNAMSTMMVDAPHFNKVMIDGPFQVQLFGNYKQNSVYLFGPNAGIRSVIVEVKGDTLCIRAAPGSKDTRDMQKVIIRVGVADLKKLVNMGNGQVEARQLRSTALAIDNKGSGNLYLAGNFNLRSIKHTGSGCLNIFGAVSSMLDIDTNGAGKVNVAGRVGLRSIKHSGSSDINIIGADGGSLKLDACGSGKIGIFGRPNIAEINAKDNVCVYAYYLSSDGLYVYTSQNSRVGLAGNVNNLYVNTSNHSNFEGRYLQAKTAYVRASHASHVNVNASSRLFAAATDHASIYYFGSPATLSQFVKGSAIIMPIWHPGQPATVAAPVWKDSPAAKTHKHKKAHTTKRIKKKYYHKKTRSYKKS